MGYKRAARGKGKDFFVKFEGIVRKALILMENTRERERLYIEERRMVVVGGRKGSAGSAVVIMGKKFLRKHNGRAENIFRKH